MKCNKMKGMILPTWLSHVCHAVETWANVTFRSGDPCRLMVPKSNLTTVLLGNFTQFTTSKTAPTSPFSSKYTPSMEELWNQTFPRKGWSWNGREKGSVWNMGNNHDYPTLTFPAWISFDLKLGADSSCWEASKMWATCQFAVRIWFNTRRN